MRPAVESLSLGWQDPRAHRRLRFPYDGSRFIECKIVAANTVFAGQPTITKSAGLFIFGGVGTSRE